MSEQPASPAGQDATEGVMGEALTGPEHWLTHELRDCGWEETGGAADRILQRASQAPSRSPPTSLWGHLGVDPQNPQAPSMRCVTHLPDPILWPVLGLFPDGDSKNALWRMAGAHAQRLRL